MSHSKLTRLICAATVATTVATAALPAHLASAGPPWNPDENQEVQSFALRRPYDIGRVLITLPAVKRAPRYKPIISDSSLDQKRSTFVVKFLQLVARAETALAMYQLGILDPDSDEGRRLFRHGWDDFMDAGDVADLVETIDRLGWDHYSRDVGDISGGTCEKFAYFEICYDEPWLQVGLRKELEGDIATKAAGMIAMLSNVVKAWETDTTGAWAAAPDKDTTPLRSEGDFKLEVWHEMVDPVFPPIWSKKKRLSWKRVGALVAGGLGIVGSIAALPFTGGVSVVGIVAGGAAIAGGAGATVTGTAGSGVMHVSKPHHQGLPMNLFWGLTDDAVEQITHVNTTHKRRSSYVAMFLPLLLWERGFAEGFDRDALDQRRQAYFDKLMEVMEGLDLSSKDLTADKLTTILKRTDVERKALILELQKPRYQELEYFLR
jgi:hypothetical protein